MGDSKMGLQARLMSQALRKLTATIGRTGCCCIFINQLREKIGVMFGNPETTTGGNALKFYASMRLDIRKSGTSIKDRDGNLIGNPIKVKVVKNKLAPPFRIALFEITFGEGISRTGEIVDIGTDLDIIKKSGSWYAYNDAKIAQGREAAKQFMIDNPEVAEEISKKIKAHYQSAIKVKATDDEQDEDLGSDD
jgi:recombination protein RecA